ncbi:GAF domain-containing protein [Paraconexibacter sp. AEG42_29]
MGRSATSPAVPFGTTPSERVTMARSLAVLYAAGGALANVTVLVPHAHNTEELGVLAPGTLALIVAVLLYRFSGRVSVGALRLLLAHGAILVTVCVIFGGDSADAYPFLYLWVSLYACYFFSTGIAAGMVGFCIVLHAGALTIGLTDHTTPGVHWLMATGTLVVGGLLISRLTAAIRAQSEDLATVSRMAGGLSDVEEFAQATCESLRGSSGADVVIFLEPVEVGLQVTAMAGASEAGMAFAGDAARKGMQRAFRGGEPVELLDDVDDGHRSRLSGHIIGLAQPVVRDGETAAVLAVAWTRPRRALPDRVRTAAMLFAAEASLALDRAARASEDRERQALEINDNIVQGLVVAKYCAQRGDNEESIRAIDETLGRARRLITDQLQNVSRGRSGAIRPGDLARTEASSVDLEDPAATR